MDKKKLLQSAARHAGIYVTDLSKLAGYHRRSLQNIMITHGKIAPRMQLALLKGIREEMVARRKEIDKQKLTDEEKAKAKEEVSERFRGLIDVVNTLHEGNDSTEKTA